MDRPLLRALDTDDLAWPDNRNMDSDDLRSLALPNPSWMPSLSDISASANMVFTHAGQLSPISNGMDASTSASSASLSPHGLPTADLGSSLTHNDAWTMAYSRSSEASEDSMESDRLDDVAWEQGSDDILVAPKLEPRDDDDFCMDNLKEAPLTPMALPNPDRASSQPRTKRPRGRPRKHPLPPNVAANKITKGRSKTGCLTCRKRKKKCDEAKPRCLNCEKNSVICEGYPEKQIWKSGKERAEEECMRICNLSMMAVQPIFPGLETVEDRIFWKHYNEHLSTVLTVEGEHKNAFKDMMIPLAVKNQGLMHSILSLASKHIDFDTPYGINMLKNNPGTTREALDERATYHHDQARKRFCHEDGTEKDNLGISARYGQMLCFLLEARATGNPRGEHHLHLGGYYSIMTSSPPPQDANFLSFISEFFQYHIFADELLNCESASKEPPASPHIHPPRLLGVADGLLNYVSQITAIRNAIRSNMLAHVDPVVDYTSLYRAEKIDVAIRAWFPQWPPGDSRERVGLLYKHMAWIYLVRTVYPPSSSAASSMSSSTVSLPLVHSSPSHGRSASSVMNNTPPQSASTSCASSPRLSGFGYGLPITPHGSLPGPSSLLPSSRNDSITDVALPPSSQTLPSRPDSPPPIRRPVLNEHDLRITNAVDQSLEIIDTFKPSDPSQTLLLLPCFIIGTACFTPIQQEKIGAAIRTFKGYTGMRNADLVIKVLEEVWAMMSAGKWSDAWDWPSIARRMDLSFIPA
ncbi:transcriptional regulatory protein moc3 [Echria macrotheca]|uniref:Transcriptional regulatory protein moc3 n=1 Tax=Echria macrotheca TaxID=438768 RepID=A0AAJ0F755_9PEZI|nr:transcriptional regulatory protein moc3 [Echria macrotheca]